MRLRGCTGWVGYTNLRGKNIEDLPAFNSKYIQSAEPVPTADRLQSQYIYSDCYEERRRSILEERRGGCDKVKERE